MCKLAVPPSPFLLTRPRPASRHAKKLREKKLRSCHESTGQKNIVP